MIHLHRFCLGDYFVREAEFSFLLPPQKSKFIGCRRSLDPTANTHRFGTSVWVTGECSRTGMTRPPRYACRSTPSNKLKARQQISVEKLAQRPRNGKPEGSALVTGTIQKATCSTYERVRPKSVKDTSFRAPHIREEKPIPECPTRRCGCGKLLMARTLVDVPKAIGSSTTLCN